MKTPCSMKGIFLSSKSDGSDPGGQDLKIPSFLPVRPGTPKKWCVVNMAAGCMPPHTMSQI